MPNHFHFETLTSGVPLGVGLHKLLTNYSLYFNRTYGRVGHLFQGRYRAFECVDEAYLLNLTTYIHKNPVRAKLVRRPEDWPWSSHREYSTGRRQLTRLDKLSERLNISPEELRGAYLKRISVLDPVLPQDADLGEIVEFAANEAGISVQRLLSGERGVPYVRAKRTLVKNAVARGYSFAELARLLKCSDTALRKLAAETEL